MKQSDLDLFLKNWGTLCSYKWEHRLPTLGSFGPWKNLTIDAIVCAAPSQKYFALSLKHTKEGNIIDMHTINCCFPVKFKSMHIVYNQIEKKWQYSCKSTEFNKGDSEERGGEGYATFLRRQTDGHRKLDSRGVMKVLLYPGIKRLLRRPTFLLPIC